MASALEDIVRCIVQEEIAKLTGAQSPAGAPPPAKRGRGRPVVGEAPAPVAASPAAAGGQTAAAASQTATATTPFTADDPFATQAPAAPTATIDEVRAALTALKNATTQDNALKVLKAAGGADNLPSLKPEKYGEVVVACKNSMPGVAPTVQTEPDDPFALPTEAAPAEKPPTKEELKALVVETQKRTSAETVQKIVMEHGGKAKNADTGFEGPNFNALPASKYGVVAAALRALPSTK